MNTLEILKKIGEVIEKYGKNDSTGKQCLFSNKKTRYYNTCYIKHITTKVDRTISIEPVIVNYCDLENYELKHILVHIILDLKIEKGVKILLELQGIVNEVLDLENVE